VEDILLELALDSTQGSSVQRFREEETEWSLQGGYGYFLTRAGAFVALTFISWVVRTVFRFSKTGYNNSGVKDG